MGNGVGGFHGFFQRAGDVAHHGQPKKHTKGDPEDNGADRESAQRVVAAGGGIELGFGFIQLQIDQGLYAFPQGA